MRRADRQYLVLIVALCAIAFAVGHVTAQDANTPAPPDDWDDLVPWCVEQGHTSPADLGACMRQYTHTEYDWSNQVHCLGAVCGERLCNHWAEYRRCVRGFYAVR